MDLRLFQQKCILKKVKLILNKQLLKERSIMTKEQQKRVGIGTVKKRDI